MKKLLLGALGVFVLLLIVAQFLPKPPEGSKSVPEEASDSNTVNLNPDFRLAGNTLIIVNRDAFAYKELDATVNEDYHYTATSLAPGASLEIPLYKFAKKDGQRYSPLAIKIMSMSLYAENPEGKPGKVVFTHK